MILFSSLSAKVGALMLVGGGSTTTEMAKKFAELCGGFDSKVVVLAQTREDPKRGDASVKFLKEQGFADVELFSDIEFSQERREALTKSILAAKGIWVPGGDQRLIVERIGADFGRELFTKAIKNGTNWFGTSAGAMCVSDPMIREESTERGFGLVDALIDTHYVKRNREMRLKRAFFAGNASHGIGLDEGEWVIIRENAIEEKKGTPKFFLREMP